MDSGLKLWGILGSSAIVLSNGSPTLVKAAARLAKVVFHDRIQICDGVDDEVQIQAAIDALPATGGEVKLLDGTYNIEVSLVLDSYQTLKGCGRNTILTTTTANLDILTAIGGLGTEKVGIVLADLTVDGTAGGAVNDIGVLWTYVDYSKILNCWILNNGEEGIQLSNCDGNEILGNSFTGTTWDAIYLNASTRNVVSANVMVGNDVGVYMDATANYNTITGNTIIGGSTGLHLTAVDYNGITDNIIQGTSVRGIYISGADGNTMSGNTIQGNVAGILLTNGSLNNNISSNDCVGNTAIAIQVESNSHNNTISGNTCVGNTLDGIYITASLRNTVSGNVVQGNSYGIEVDNSAHYTTVAGNTCNDNTNSGINIVANYCTVNGNTCCNNNGSGIQIAGEGHTVSGNTCEQNDDHGIELSGANHCTVIGNTCIANSQTATNTKDGILLSASDYNNIQGNTCRAGALAAVSRYGINVSNATSNENRVIDNDLYDDGFATAPFNDAGTDTKLDVYVVPFSDGSDPQDSGYEIDLAAEFARAWLRLPAEVVQVVRLKIYARAAILSAAAMRLEINVNGGADNEPFNTHATAAPNTPSTSTNFAADDVIYWTLSSAQIVALLGGDSVEVKVLHEIAGGADVVTDAFFRTVEIEYV